MNADWLIEAATGYNRDSLSKRDSYPGIVFLPIDSLSLILDWTFHSLPDEILVGLDIDSSRFPMEDDVRRYTGSNFQSNLFAGQGMILGEPHLVNRGDSYEVHHVPEEWVDDLFAEDRGPRGGRFTHWLHTHPNAPAIPSHADADASQYTDGVDMILGVWFSPEGDAVWYDGPDHERRSLAGVPIPSDKPVIGLADTGHLIHGIELIAFHRRGFAINVVITDREGVPIE